MNFSKNKAKLYFIWLLLLLISQVTEAGVCSNQLPQSNLFHIICIWTPATLMNCAGSIASIKIFFMNSLVGNLNYVWQGGNDKDSIIWILRKMLTSWGKKEGVYIYCLVAFDGLAFNPITTTFLRLFVLAPRVLSKYVSVYDWLDGMIIWLLTFQF